MTDKKLSDITTRDVTIYMLWFIFWGIVIAGLILLAGRLFG